LSFIGPLSTWSFIDELHRDEGARLGAVRCIGRHGFVDFEDGRDMRMMKLRCRLRLAIESLAVILVGQGRRGQHLNRYNSIELGVLGLVDDPHAAAAEFGVDAVMR
jgi:hypothetical protein